MVLYFFLQFLKAYQIVQFLYVSFQRLIGCCSSRRSNRGYVTANGRYFYFAFFIFFACIQGQYGYYRIQKYYLKPVVVVGLGSGYSVASAFSNRKSFALFARLYLAETLNTGF